LHKYSLTAGEIKHILFLTTDSKENTACHMVRVLDKPDVLQKVQDLAADSPKTEKIKISLLATDCKENRLAESRRGGELEIFQNKRDLTRKTYQQRR
jgi:hypothetical protein